ncbi:MAG: D-alanine--D-alanine ligase [Candidatus Dormibacteraeota bacterium]|nr:D-alanine--D-alanine ligase [Candidatus Dormibacteraeota bacterium]
MRVAVLLGGRSAEAEVSRNSGAAVRAALEQAGHQAVDVELDPQVWDTLRDGGFDCCFIALHGRLGEDGTVQGMCELLDLPYTGSDVLASALCIDKTRANRLLRAAGLAVPEFEELSAPPAVEGGLVERLVGTYGLPLVVKPVREGSTVGLTIARDEDALASGLVLGARYDRRLLIQRFQPGTEITVGVLATPEVEVLPTLEITYEGESYSYTAKYTAGLSHHTIPARISGVAREAAAEAASVAFRTLGCDGMARVDFIVAEDGTPWVLEANTVPGLTPLSLLPDAARAVGIDMPELCDRQVRWAVERHAARVGPR